MHLSLKLLFLFLLSPSLYADEVVSNFLSVKGMGMGGAYSSLAKGHDSIFVNPAGLASNSDFQLRIMGLNLGINGLNAYSEYSDMVSNAGSDLGGVINQLYGRPIWARLDFQTSINFYSVTFGAYAASSLGFSIHNPAYPQLYPGYFAEYGAFLGWGREIIANYLDFGFLIRRATRYSGSGTIGPSTIAYLDSSVLQDQFKRKGTAYAADWGVKLKFPSEWHPTFSFVWQNVGHTTYALDADVPGPASVPDQMNVGLGFEKDFWAFVVRPALEYKNINGSDIQLGKNIHAGVEVEFPVFSVRGGYSQGYYTAGATMDLWYFRLDAVSYGVEMGAYPGQEEDRRYAVQLVADFSFNLSTGDFFSMSKARKNQERREQRGLKHRR